MREAFIVAAARTAVGKSKKGALAHTSPAALGALVVEEALRRVPRLDPAEVEDVILGCAMPEGAQGLNLARQVAIAAGLPVSVPGQTVNRFCSSGLQTIALAAQQVLAGMGEIVVAGGVESMSAVPMSGFRFRPDPDLALRRPEVYVGMGQTAENLAREAGVSREDSDRFAARSHERALAAIAAGRFRAEIVPALVETVTVGDDGARATRSRTFEVDEGPRAGSTPEVLAKLPPVFHPRGQVTAGNSSQTSDGAAAVVVMSGEAVKRLGVSPLARFVSFAVAGVRPEVMGIGPVEAVPKALRLAGLSLEAIDVVELNEAFACQALAVIRALGLDEDKTNVNGGAIALGHPLGATGAKLTTQILYEMARRRSRYGLVTMCIGGGMGAAGVFEAAA